jgi:hypothetical protein
LQPIGSAVQSRDRETAKSRLPIFHARAGRYGWLSYVSHRVLFAFPPTSLLMAVLSRVHTLGLQCVVVGPVWPDQPWWHWVAGLQKAKRLALGKVQACICKGESG